MAEPSMLKALGSIPGTIKENVVKHIRNHLALCVIYVVNAL
jgi:hypothetical protein